jgi:hypothetical protein
MLNGTPPSVGMADAINSSITCLAIDDAMNCRNIVDVVRNGDRLGWFLIKI